MKIAILSGAGISAESGISTFRDIKDGLWYNYNVDQVATVEGWNKNPELVLEFHNMLRAKLHDKEPNAGHLALVDLEKEHDVTIVTQNVDNLHEKAGSKNILHIHGELFKARDSFGEIQDCFGELNIGALDKYNEQLRPHTVLFGELPYNWDESVKVISEADILMVIGTSFSIGYLPHLVGSCKSSCKVYYIDPHPDSMIENIGLFHLTIVPENASTGVSKVINKFII